MLREENSTLKNNGFFDTPQQNEKDVRKDVQKTDAETTKEILFEFRQAWEEHQQEQEADKREVWSIAHEVSVRNILDKNLQLLNFWRYTTNAGERLLQTSVILFIFNEMEGHIHMQKIKRKN